MSRLIALSLKAVIFFVIFVLIMASLTAGIITFRYPGYVASLIEKHLIPEEEPEQIELKGLGIIGDSQSDEYRADDNRGSNRPTTTLNWVEILAQERNVNIGEWSFWEEPRRQGYAYNWARSSATTASMIESRQHTGVASQVRSGEVNAVIIHIGGNDFAPYWTEDGYQAIYNGDLSDAELELKQNFIVARIQTAVDVIHEAGEAQLFLVTIPDWGNHVGVKLAFPLPHQRMLVTRAIRDTNEKLIEMADERGIPVIDSNDFYTSLKKDSTSDKILVGDIELEWLHLNNSPRNLFLNDGLHTGTAFNALLANYIIKQLNPYLVNDISQLSDEEILDVSGVQ